MLYQEWTAHRESDLQYSHRDSWDRMLQSGVQLLERFAQDDRVRIAQPRLNLQAKFIKPVRHHSPQQEGKKTKLGSAWNIRPEPHP